MNTYSFSKPERRYQVDDFDTTIIQVNDKTRMDEHGHYRSKDSLIIKPTKRWVIEPAEDTIVTNPILTYNGSALKYLIINSVKELDTTVQLIAENLQKTNDQLKEINDSLSIVVKQLHERIARLETVMNISYNDAMDVILEQNNPNPFAEQTTITYYIPDKLSGNAELIIAPANQNSTVLQKHSLSKGLPTQLVVSAEKLYTGVFVYSIVIEGQVLSSKKFIIIK